MADRVTRDRRVELLLEQLKTHVPSPLKVGFAHIQLHDDGGNTPPYCSFFVFAPSCSVGMPGDIIPKGQQSHIGGIGKTVCVLFVSDRSFTVRSQTLITRRHAICHAPQLTEPEDAQVSCFFLPPIQKTEFIAPDGANGKDKNHVAGPSQPGGR